MKKNDENMEDEFFREDSNKSLVIKLVIAGSAILIIVIALIISVFLHNKKNGKDDIQKDIVDYSMMVEPVEQAESEDDDIIGNEADTEETMEVPTPLPTLEPTPTPEVLPSPEPNGPVMEEKGKKDYSKIKFDTKSNLKEMEGYFADYNENALWDLSHLDRFIAMSYSFRDTTDYGYYGDVDSDGQPNGRGVAVYADNQYYYGEWVHGKRSGAGTWIHYHIHNVDNVKDKTILVMYKGSFANDLPNGEGQLHFSLEQANLAPSTTYITNYLCDFKDGMINGDVYCTSTNDQGGYDDWNGTAVKGSFEYISESRDGKKRGPVMTHTENPDSYYWLSTSDNRNIGVPSYISEFTEEN